MAALALLGAAALASRRPAPSAPALPGASVLAPAAPSAPAPPEPPPPAPATLSPEGPAAGAPVQPEVMTVEGEDYRVHVFAFRPANAHSEVVDVEMSRDVAGVLERTRASFVINGGFFDRQTRPEGLVVVDGRELAPLAPSLGGGVLVVSGGRAALHDAAGFVLSPGAHLAVQGLPWLVLSGSRNVRSDGGRAGGADGAVRARQGAAAWRPSSRAGTGRRAGPRWGCSPTCWWRADASRPSTWTGAPRPAWRGARTAARADGAAGADSARDRGAAGSLTGECGSEAGVGPLASFCSAAASGWPVRRTRKVSSVLECGVKLVAP